MERGWGGGGGGGKQKKEKNVQAKQPRKKLLNTETEEKILAEENFTCRVECQGIIIKNNIKCCDDSKFSSVSEVLKMKVFPVEHALDPLAFYA